MTDRLALVHEHLDRLRKHDAELAAALQEVVDRIEAIDPAEASRSWQEKAEQLKAEAQVGPKER